MTVVVVVHGCFPLGVFDTCDAEKTNMRPREEKSPKAMDPSSLVPRRGNMARASGGHGGV